MIKIKATGMGSIKKRLNAIEKKLVDHAFNQALQDLGEKIGELSSPKVPVQEGMLKSSFTVQKVGDKWVCGYNQEYAAYQHQGMDKNGARVIEKRPGGGGSFFLSEPAKKNKKQLLEFLQERLNIHLQKIV